MRFQVRSLKPQASLSELRICRCCELWCRLQTQLGSCVAVVSCGQAAVAPIRPLACLGTSICHRFGPKKQKKKKNQKTKTCGLSLFGGTDWVKGLQSAERGQHQSTLNWEGMDEG